MFLRVQISVYSAVYIVGACIARPAILAQNCIAVGEKSLFSFEKSKKCSIFWRATNGRPYGILGTLNTNLQPIIAAFLQKYTTAPEKSGAAVYIIHYILYSAVTYRLC